MDDVMLHDVEEAGEKLYREAKYVLDAPAPMSELCRRLIGKPPEIARINCAASVAMVNGSWRVFVRRGVPPPRVCFAIAHEIAHVYYMGARMPHRELEERCDRLGAVLVAPKPAFMWASRHTRTIARLAMAFCTLQGVVLLRLGECVGTPVALVEPHRVIARGKEFPWPVEERLREIAYSGMWCGRRVKITDGPDRVGLIAGV